ncbi:DUF6058 family natural product biosynthesis protein [Microbulbifer sp. 2304DJ12-6]|uniref:DUF6058 family natural product biosynthesis protein n=1 Tax=Microbulbifer sp. 2304DJ12-6 TaxID=3233340 RepID=UPI002630D786|nr:DUF6058 family natural product biosynthesis protein [uncultured Microbulbifer sp.]
MELVRYFFDNFYTKNQLLDKANVDEGRLLELQNLEVMPRASYSLEISIQCDSFFGAYEASENSEFYSKGYLSWVNILLSLEKVEDAKKIFKDRYCQQLESLREDGIYSNSPKLNSELELTLDSEWKYFLDGTYGLCTKNGLPEQIASKEIAILIASDFLDCDLIEDQSRKKLIKIIDLLDDVSSYFAPHERESSSRQKYINELRLRYDLTS